MSCRCLEYFVTSVDDRGMDSENATWPIHRVRTTLGHGVLDAIRGEVDGTRGSLDWGIELSVIVVDRVRQRGAIW